MKRYFIVFTNVYIFQTKKEDEFHWIFSSSYRSHSFYISFLPIVLYNEWIRFSSARDFSHQKVFYIKRVNSSIFFIFVHCASRSVSLCL